MTDIAVLNKVYCPTCGRPVNHSGRILWCKPCSTAFEVIALQVEDRLMTENISAINKIAFLKQMEG